MPSRTNDSPRTSYATKGAKVAGLGKESSGDAWRVRPHETLAGKALRDLRTRDSSALQQRQLRHAAPRPAERAGGKRPMKTLALEPCPMCGDDPYILYHPEDDPNKIQVKVQCECGLTMTHWIGIIEDRWNRRKDQGMRAHCEEHDCYVEICANKTHEPRL